MALRSVRVPPDMQPLFEKAETVVSEYFRQRKDSPDKGTIEIFGQRYVLVRAASLSVEFFDLVRDLFGPSREAESADFARNILFDLAHSIGKSDARNFHAKMSLEDPIARLSAGPVHFAHTGWAFVDILEESRPGPEEEFFFLYDHPYSFESEAWRDSGKVSSFPVCIMNAGYSSGWCEESFGVQLVSSEVLCRARGDECCRFVMAHPDQIEERLRTYMESEPALAPSMLGYQIPDFFSRKRLEDGLRQAGEQLEARVAERTEELRVANERLRQEMIERQEVERRLAQSQKLEAVGLLAGGVAHDFNNLLTAILGYSDLMQREAAVGGQIAGYAREVAAAAQRAKRLTNQLLVFSKQRSSAPRLVDLSLVVRTMTDMLRRLIGEDVELQVDLGPGQLVVLADPGQLEQVVVNLVVNARDAMPRGGSLSVRMGLETLADERRAAALGVRVGDYVLLEVRDTGCGMDAEIVAHLFEPFFTTKQPGRGTGLGLATVYGILQEAGGGVTVDTAPGQGATFRILLPRAEGEPERAGEVELAEEVPERRPTVLLVEDEQIVRNLARRVLELNGVSVLVAEGPVQALQLLEAHEGDLDLLLSDVIMPGMSGLELARQLRARQPGLRALFMSGYTADMIDRHGGLESGDVLLPKPFTVSTLEAALHKALES
jgi:signal transduction histidine kinase/ActR/RegA family two-component response regulator